MKISTDMTSKVNLVKEIANLLRGPYTSEKYGNVIIPMAIIRRFDCILESKNKEIKDLLTQMESKRSIIQNNIFCFTRSKNYKTHKHKHKY